MVDDAHVHVNWKQALLTVEIRDEVDSDIL
jgi:hypothetical protein